MAQSQHDVLVIGAGFAGLYQLYSLREAGFNVRVIEAGDEVGGTWYWNRYPGARCDIDSIEYSYSFDEDLQQEWVWSERYAAQPELFKYLKHVADRFDLRKDIDFGLRVKGMSWDEDSRLWTVETTTGETYLARFVVAATGNLSVPTNPSFEGMDDFEGDLYWTSSYPEGTDLTGKRVAVVGTGSSGLQTITTIGPVVGSLTVFQRTPCFSIPAQNGPLGEKLVEAKKRYPEIRQNARYTMTGYECGWNNATVADTPPEEVQREFDRRWAAGGLCVDSAFTDLAIDPKANEVLADYFRARIREVVKDPVTAEKLTPRSYPILSKRLCVDTGYYQVYNQDNVELVDIREEPIERFTTKGIRAGGREHEFDVIILATGFDAMTGAMLAMDVRNGDLALRDKWEHGPRTYAGLMSAGFPNLFIVTGPQSPGVLSNVVTSIEQHVEFISRMLIRVRDAGLERIEPDLESENGWVTLTNDLANMTIMPQAASWYMGANVPGKERVFMPFIGGVGLYRQALEGIEVGNYHGFAIA